MIFMEEGRLYPSKKNQKKNNCPKNMKRYLMEFDVEYQKELYKNHNELPFLAERVNIRRVEILVPNLRDKLGYVIHIKKLNQALWHSLKF